MSAATPERHSSVLVQAARTGGFAPSIHNTQPWRWRVDGARLALRAQRQRQLPVSDPSGRMLTISCGAALHHASVALAAQGWAARIDRLPRPDDPDLLAVITLGERVDVTPAAMRQLQTVRIRHTDRRPVSDTPVPPEHVDQLRHTAQAHGAQLHVLRHSDVVDLASVSDRAQRVEALDESWREELSYWVTGAAGAGLGVPDDTIPSRPPPTTVPGRDFGRSGTLPVGGAGHDRAATYAILYGDEDSTLGWLCGGEALSAVWLRATQLGLSVLPLSAAAEVITTRQALRGMLSGLGEPFLVLRLGVADPDQPGPPHPPRLPAAQVVELVDDAQ